MWILSTEGDFLQGKRIWLKPGKKYLFGRVHQEPNSHSHIIDNRTISRKHLIVEVGQALPGDGAHIHVRSKLTVSDPGSRWGTFLDSKVITGESKELTGRDEYKLFLGKYPFVLRITWHPVVLSFSFPGKQLKEKDPLAHARSRLEALDIKTVIPYIVEKTTHVVSRKRNTAKSLQALVNGAFVVQDSFIENITYAAAPKNVEHEESLSLLEEDFDAAWPNPLEYLPPQGTEPTQLPNDVYAPNPERIHIFEGYTFVFGDSARFEDLQGPISNGHGKALLYKVEPGKTTARELYSFMKEAAGRKGFACEQDGIGGVILVQFSFKGHEKWCTAIGNEIELLTRQKAILASEFLDAILQNRPQQLCKPSNDEEMVLSATQEPAPSTVNQIRHPTTVVESNHEENTRPRKRARVQSYFPKFKNFDDGFDMDSIPVHTLEEEAEVPGEPTQATITDPLGNNAMSQALSADEGDTVGDLLPGAAAMRERFGLRKSTVQAAPQPAPKPTRKKLDVMEAARQRREAVDEAAMARRQEEAASFQAIAGSMDLSQLQKLAIVEEMEIKPRVSQSSLSQSVSQGDRWDERWNGRKNFKKFRRKGDGGSQLRIQTIIVPLEEAKRKDFGIGDEYWSHNEPNSAPNIVASESIDREPSVTPRETPRETPAPALAATTRARTNRQQKRPRGDDDDDNNSDDGLRFRFRRKRQR
ncbi:hypothetical protein FQN57_003520 [Myotisia sp. PD_48]|nr:hypothetical protein FQN57_003520 [Myotisia sp. PD_48]